MKGIMVRSEWDYDRPVEITLTQEDAMLLLEAVADAAGRFDMYSDDAERAYHTLAENWIEATGWNVNVDYGPWVGFIEDVEEMREKRGLEPDAP